MKVGFFDSGVGGTSVLEAFRRCCPEAETEYLADSAHCPYGNRPAEEIVRLAEANVRELLRRGCGMIVVACNTATAAAIEHLRATFPEVPFVGMEPALKPAARDSRTGVVGVLATAGTFNGRLYHETKAKFAKDVTVIAAVADEFVELVENSRVPGADRVDPTRLLTPEVEKLVRARLEPLLKAGCDEIVLGCTHFPHLRPVIEKVVAARATVVDPSDAVARQAERIFRERSR